MLYVFHNIQRLLGNGESVNAVTFPGKLICIPFCLNCLHPGFASTCELVTAAIAYKYAFFRIDTQPFCRFPINTGIRFFHLHFIRQYHFVNVLAYIIGCLDTASSGRYILHGREIEDLSEAELAAIRSREIEDLSEAELAAIRSREIGFVFQNSQLLPRLTALKNVEMPLIYAGVSPGEITSPIILS